MMETEMAPETLDSFNHLTWLMAREDLIKVSLHDSFAPYIHISTGIFDAIRFHGQNHRGSIVTDNKLPFSVWL
jgi:hypothetical protein